ncbi:thioredoxin family protein [Azospirillum brasilense]|uniref:thioredoxin family protein n=1 Tax=Azospirillum brasilense TaxID=192 RepID=UPI000E68FDB2|nr:co-chaperone YbbN [Azospirillum brasilense]NUB27097.1 tetratricopeptide repeat protein [Azospirillum brasilense]NUB33024.1 tetratricopeptide repeat protein [Azospirillum brasilense]RIW00477.1 co-chaperone YbbN [Azospirillum brasilense]
MFSIPPANKPVAAGAAPAAAGDLIKDSSDRAFMADVIEASQSVPVIVDFWAPWCGPCKQLGPILEKTVLAAKGKVRLVKIDTDKDPMIASQLRVQSIPAVYAFFQGRPVDGFMGALPESQVKAFVEKLLKLAGAAGGAEGDILEEAMAQAKEALEAGDTQTASEIYGEILQADPENLNAAAYAGLVRCLIVNDELARAKQMLDKVPEPIAKDKEIAAVRSALEVAEQAANAGPIPELMEKVAHNQDDHEARFDLALALFAAGKREAAVDELLELVRRDRAWNDEAARKQLVKFFEAFGPTDPLTVQSRRRLSSILFR